MAEFELEFKHDSWNFTAALQAQAVDFLGSATLLSSTSLISHNAFFQCANTESTESFHMARHW